MKMRQTIRHVSLLMPLVALLGGCGDGGQKPHASVSHYQVSDKPALPAQQILNRRIAMSPRTLDPSLATGIPAFNVIQDLFEGLLTLSADGKLVPGLATSWDVSPDGKTYVFHLRPNAKWSNGKPLTAGDFVYAWRRVVDPATGAQYADSLSPVVNASAIIDGKKKPDTLGVEAVDAHTFKVQLVKPTPYFLTMLYNQYLFPLYKPAIEKWGDAWTRPEHMVSDGPFKLTEWVINGHLTLEKNPYYYGADKVLLQKEIEYPISEADSALSRYLAGDLDFVNNPAFPASDYDWLKQSVGDQIRVSPYYACAYLGMMVHKPPFNNRDLRLALNLVLNRKVLSNKLSGGMQIPAYSLFPPLPGYQQQVPDWASWPMDKRIAEARRLYKKAGYSKDHPLKVELLYMTEGVSTQNYMEAVSTMWNRALGSQITLRNEEWKVMLQDLQYKNAKLFWSAWVGDYPEPYTFAQQFLASFAMNYGSYNNPAYQKAVKAAAGELDTQQRYASYEAAERILNKDVPMIPLYFYKAPELVKPYVAGVENNVVALHLARYIYIRQHSEKGQ
ncbi:peptide ABC transporter substrate-binding protein [Gallaecimonas mangrovi]|uniref:peptide ABC transporter substrate-binding protein n=1 Tax=Gallaecimonas mangrovi TaxID=2291597 RepID=UPI000E1FC0F9|nr:peptide ABC transporter substrate-binding protein [Gallaecimonas mangrovi]